MTREWPRLKGNRHVGTLNMTTTIALKTHILAALVWCLFLVPEGSVF